MGLVLQVLGVVFLLLLLALAIFAFRIWRTIKQTGGVYGGDFVKLLELLPPLKLELEKSDKHQWKSLTQLADDEKYLTERGFRHAGYFFTQQHATAIQLSLWGHPHGIAACLMEAEAPEVEGTNLYYVCDVGAMLREGGSVFVSNSPFATFLPRAEADPKYVHEHFHAPQLLAALKQHLSEKTSIKPIKHLSEEFRLWFETHSEWLWNREQLQSPAMQEVFEPLGIIFNDDLVDQLTDYAQVELHELYSERIKKRLAKNPKMTAEQWENMRDRLVIIHEKTPIQTALDEIYSLLDNTDEDYYEHLENLRTQYQSARDFFDHALEKFNLIHRLKRIGSTNPLAVAMFIYCAEAIH